MRFISNTKKKKKPWMIPTGETAKHINSEISKLKTSMGDVDLSDTPKKYYTSCEKMEYHMHMLSVYEDEGYIVDMSGGLAKLQNEAIMAEVEHDFLIRAQRRMHREAIELKTDKAKYNKAQKFYQELEFYYPKMYPSNISYVEQLKSQDRILKDYEKSKINEKNK